MEIKKILNWTFGNKEIDLSIFTVTWNKNVIINIHWLFWSKTSSWKYLNFAKNLYENKQANVVLFATSRKNLNYDEKISEYENKIKKFEGKNFEDELEDTCIVVQDILENSEKYFNIKKEDLEITINWNSLWWTLAFFLAFKFKEIKNISTIWTWLRKNREDLPILSNFPILKEYKEKIENFKWKLLMNQAWNDKVFSKESYEEFFNLASNTISKEKIIYEGYDHSFKKIFWEENDLAYKTYLKNFVKFFEL